MSSDASFTLILAKEDFKFSCAHFTLFGPDDAELLHGHNYQVALELIGFRLDEFGLLADIVPLKKAIRSACARLDSRTLIPFASPLLTITESGDEVEIRFRGRRYLLPRQDVVFLPLANTSMELFAQMLWQELHPLLPIGLSSLGVAVAETAGQSCMFRASVESRTGSALP
jgi:6-pyruvoyltetrahydropterin/6-carboxytetrahydropterin synthase